MVDFYSVVTTLQVTEPELAEFSTRGSKRLKIDLLLYSPIQPFLLLLVLLYTILNVF